MFINTTNNSIFIQTYREPNAQVGDIFDIVDAVKSGECACMSFIDASEVIDVLEDGSLWTDDYQESIETLHHAVTNYKRGIEK